MRDFRQAELLVGHRGQPSLLHRLMAAAKEAACTPIAGRAGIVGHAIALSVAVPTTQPLPFAGICSALARLGRRSASDRGGREDSWTMVMMIVNKRTCSEDPFHLIIANETIVDLHRRS